MIHFHGGRHSTNRLAEAIWTGHHGMISYADAPEPQVQIALARCPSYAFDNGTFTAWRQKRAVDWEGFYKWVNSHRQGNLAFVLVPDVIEGTAEDNDALLESCPLPRWLQMPVWHLHEPLARLQRLRDEYGRVALGSSGEYRTPGAARWWRRMAAAMETLCDGKGFPVIPFHGLRMQHPSIFNSIPFASTDSAMVSRSVGTTNWKSPYATAPDESKARALLDYIDAAPKARRWDGIPQQHELFEEMEIA